MTANIDTDDGLVNGVMGEVKAFIRNQNDIICIILVEFDNDKVGTKARKSSEYRTTYPKAVPVERHKAQYQKQDKIGAEVTRMQFPLTLAWAVTIHKCQGLTLTQIVVDMKGGKKFNKGQAYVAFSRVKSIDGLYLLNFDSAGIKTDPAVSDVMNELHKKTVPVIKAPAFLNMITTSKITIGHLNIHFFFEKQKDLLTDFRTFQPAEVMCFTETYLRKNDNISTYLQKCNFISYRKHIYNNIEQNKHGVMVCVSSTLHSEELQVIGIKNIEFCAISVKIGSRNMTVCAVYISPKLDMTTIVKKIKLLINSFKRVGPIILSGDFNTDLSKNTQTRLATCLELLGFHQCVKDPTTDYGSLLDHVYYNGNEMHVVDITDTYYSDHDLVLCTIELPN